MITDRFRQFKHAYRQRRAIAEITARPSVPGKPHGLPGPLIVSLTSYAARFETLSLTLRALLRQSLKPDKVILWLDAEDEGSLPADVLALKPEGLEILVCPRWRSFKKIIPTLQAWPEAFIVTADDDVYYPIDWLAGLVNAVSEGAKIACHRAHRVTLNARGLPRNYEEWERNISQPERSPQVFLTGVMGVIYAPGVFHPDVLRHDVFLELCPSSDDIWLYWMHRLAGTEAQKVGGRARILEWTGSQTQNLRMSNLAGSGNDRAIQAMLGKYGWF